MDNKERRFTIGRSRECDIVLADDSVSRKHAELIFMEQGRLFIVDRHSQNGTALVVGGQARAIRQEFVSPTDTVQFGNVQMPVKELLEAIRLKFPAFEARASHAPPPPEPPHKPWVQGERLVRCSCGTVKEQGLPCPACGE